MIPLTDEMIITTMITSSTYFEQSNLLSNLKNSQTYLKRFENIFRVLPSVL